MKRKNLLTYVLLSMALLIIALPLASCTGSGSTSGTTMAEMTTAAAGTTAAKNEISIQGNAFNPDNLSIKIGDTVTWVNNDSYAHTVKAKTGEFDSGNMASGAKFSFTFNKEGTIDYICGIHTFMTGKIVVTK
jgi:plastocyanin